MSKPIFERYVDERGNISVRVSQDMIVLTQEEAERIEAEYKRMQADNAKLRELVRWMYDRMDESCAVQHPYAPAPISYDRLMQALARARDLGVEVDGWA